MTSIVSMDDAVYKNFQNVLEFRIGDVRSYEDVVSAVRDSDIVINAAALKQVPSCEYFPYQGLLTNCVGPQNIVRAIKEHNFPVEVVVGISTDKAAKPVNAMGMTKALQERIFTSANILIPETRFVCVRYGNVLASRGSVIPLFHKQIKTGGPVTVTVPNMTRFLINLNHAVDTVFAAIESAERGEIYIPIAPSSNVINIAKALVGKRDIEIQIKGIRPGEKMHEILISEEEVNHTVKRGDFYAIKSMLPELNDDMLSKENILKDEYSSKDDVLDLEATIKLLEENNLLFINEKNEAEGELLR
jgi:FlaA1/EpsC-like NDP-sugar epimerase